MVSVETTNLLLNGTCRDRHHKAEKRQAGPRANIPSSGGPNASIFEAEWFELSASLEHQNSVENLSY